MSPALPPPHKPFLPPLLSTWLTFQLCSQGSLPHLCYDTFILFLFSFLHWNTQPTVTLTSFFSVPTTLRRESTVNWMLSNHVTDA